MALEVAISLPPSGSSVGGILAAAKPVGGEWWRGVTFTSGQCLAPTNFGACNDGNPQTEKETQALSTTATFAAWMVFQAVHCTSSGRTALAELAGAALDVTREFAVGRELLTGAASGNPNLQDATLIGTSSSTVSALGCLEAEAAQSLSGRLALIHVAPAIATELMSAGAIWKDGRLWRTASGNVVVVSPGYDGRAPSDNSAPTNGDALTMYATGDVYAEVGQRAVNESVDRSVNTDSVWAEDAAIAIFDPCFNIAITTPVTLCAVTT